MYRAFVKAAGESRVAIPEDELHHLLRVRRSHSGDLFLGFIEGQGWHLCRLEREAGSWYGVLVEKVGQDCESPLRVALGQALIKKDRFEWVIQKATELGVSELVPLITHRSELRLDRNLEKRMRRWQKIVRESVKQCGRSRLPQLNPPEPLGTFLARQTVALKLVLDEAASQPLSELVKPGERPSACLLLVGPEGGWDDRDRVICREHGCRPVKLGPRVLRTETAPVAALAVLQFLWGDLG